METKISKKQQYLNEVRFNMDAYQEMLSSKKYLNWFEGELISKPVAGSRLAELTEELNKVFADKTYKPWKA